MSALSVKIGAKYGRLRVLRRVANNEKGFPVFECQCWEGNLIKITAHGLRTGTKSCGCLRKETTIKLAHARRLKPGQAACRLLFRSYQASAFKRNLLFSVSFEQFKALVLLPCDYCGREKSRIIRGTGYNGTFACNGIDRIENTVGYTKTNCISCCWACNQAKHNLTTNEFLTWVEKVYAHLNLRQRS